MFFVSLVKVMYEIAKLKVQQCLYFFEKYHSLLAKTCKKNPLCPSRLQASTVIFNIYELNVIHNTCVQS